MKPLFAALAIMCISACGCLRHSKPFAGKVGEIVWSDGAGRVRIVLPTDADKRIRAVLSGPSKAEEGVAGVDRPAVEPVTVLIVDGVLHYVFTGSLARAESAVRIRHWSHPAMMTFPETVSLAALLSWIEKLGKNDPIRDGE